MRGAAGDASLSTRGLGRDRSVARLGAQDHRSRNGRPSSGAEKRAPSLRWFPPACGKPARCRGMLGRRTPGRKRQSAPVSSESNPGSESPALPPRRIPSPIPSCGRDSLLGSVPANVHSRFVQETLFSSRVTPFSGQFKRLSRDGSASVSSLSAPGRGEPPGSVMRSPFLLGVRGEGRPCGRVS